MPDERTYYAICEDKCLFETLNREQIEAAIANATGQTAIDVDSAYITKIKESNQNANLTFWAGSEAAFNQLGKTAAQQTVKIDADHKVYIIPAEASVIAIAEGGTGATTAEEALTNLGAFPAILRSGKDYGDTLPTTIPAAGTMFFKKI